MDIESCIYRFVYLFIHVCTNNQNISSICNEVKEYWMGLRRRHRKCRKDYTGMIVIIFHFLKMYYENKMKNKLNFIKIDNFFARDTTKSWRRKQQSRRSFCKNTISKMCKDLLKFTKTKSNNLIKSQT